MHRAAATKCKQRAVASINAALDRYAAQRAGHRGVGDANDAERRLG